jgi:KDO2-lipid IV(A) lauroyltransferase
MRRALGPDTPPRELTARGRAVYRNFFDFIVETARPPTRPEVLAARIERIDGLEHFAAARDLGRGVIIATAHLGAFEASVAGLRAIEDRLHIVFKRDELPVFDRCRAEQRRRLGVAEIPIDDGLASWIRLRDALAAGGAVLMQADRAMPGQRSATVPFLHGHMRLPLGILRLARLSGAPIVPAFAIRTSHDSRRLRIELHEPIHVADPDPDEEPPGKAMVRGAEEESPGKAILRQAEEAALHKLAAVLASVIARHPEQWLVLQPAWIEDTQHRASAR